MRTIALIHNEGPNLDQCKRRAPAEGHQAGQFRASLGGVDELHNFAVAAPVGLLKVIEGALANPGQWLRLLSRQTDVLGADQDRDNNSNSGVEFGPELVARPAFRDG